MKEQLFEILFTLLKQSGIAGKEAHSIAVVIIDTLADEAGYTVCNNSKKIISAKLKAIGASVVLASKSAMFDIKSTTAVHLNHFDDQLHLHV